MSKNENAKLLNCQPTTTTATKTKTPKKYYQLEQQQQQQRYQQRTQQIRVTTVGRYVLKDQKSSKTRSVATKKKKSCCLITKNRPVLNPHLMAFLLKVIRSLTLNLKSKKPLIITHQILKVFKSLDGFFYLTHLIKDD
jgi:hypothetical protein